MVKILVCGDICGEFTIFINKINALQSSQHGPFHALFCTGAFFKDQAEYDSIVPSLELPIPTYVFNTCGITESTALPNNLHLLNGIGITTIEKLTIAHMVPENFINNSAEFSEVKRICTSSAYRGCDIFLSSEWPKEFHHFIPDRLYYNYKISIII